MNMKKASIEQMVLGAVSTNAWLVKNKETGEMIIIDPADNAEKIIRKIELMEGNPTAILLTHGHFDHMLAAATLREQYKIPVYAMTAEQEVLESAENNLSAYWATPYTMTADEWLVNGSKLSLAGFDILVLHTPGHTVGSCCFYIKDESVLFSGDTLFAGSIGRTDFPTSSGRQMKESLRKILTGLPEDTRVCPGHNEETTIGYEKRYFSFA